MKKRYPGLCYHFALACEAWCDNDWDGYKIHACWVTGGKFLPKAGRA